MNTGNRAIGSALYVRCERKNLKWYKKIWNYITGHEDRNWQWVFVDNEIMTFERLSNLINKYNIPKNVHLLSDSGWECNATEMCGVYYNKKQNVIIFTQEISEWGKYDKRNENHIKGFIALKDGE